MIWPYTQTEAFIKAKKQQEAAYRRMQEVTRQTNSARMVASMEDEMTEYEDWEIYNHGTTPIPKGRVQVQHRGETRIAAEKWEPHEYEDVFWDHIGSESDIIAFRRVKEPVREEYCLWQPKAAKIWLLDSRSPAYKMTLPTKDGKTVTDTFVGEETGEVIKIEWVE